MYTEEQLEKLYEELPMEERIGQLLQLNGDYYGEKGIITGQALEWEFTESDVLHAGSVLNVFGRERLRALQAEHLKNNRVPMIFMGDVVVGYGVIHPMPLGQSCSFDPEAVKKMARKCAEMVSAEGISVTFSPIADIARDARWGRCSESFGEDPYLCGSMVEATVKGYQGEKKDDPDSLSSCVKHFGAYGYAEAGRDYNTVEISERTLRETCLPSYKKAIDAGADVVMTAFNAIGGVPTTINKHLLKDILRKEWGFDGVVLTDWCSLLGGMSHRAANSHKELALLGMEAGVDIAMMDYLYNKYIPELLEEGLLSEETFKKAVMRVLRLKNKKGLFDDPYRFLRDKERDFRPQWEAALDVTEKSMVLLENREQMLPIQSGEKIALIGPYAVRTQVTSSWGSLLDIKSEYVEYPKEALERELQAEVLCEPGCAMIEYDNFLAEGERETDPCYQEPELYLERALLAAEKADKVVMMLGEHPKQFGESRSRAEIELPEIQINLLRKVYEVNPNIVTLIFNGRPLDIREVRELSKALMLCWRPGDTGSTAIAALLTGKTVPSGRLSMSMPYKVGQCPIYYSLYPTGSVQSRPEDEYTTRYLDVPNTPMYPFGYGLSYTTFAYSPVTVSTETLEAGKEINLSVSVTNTGDYDGEEVVQLYLCDTCAKGVSRPYRELKGFKRISLVRKETKEVTFTINEEMLRFHDADCNYISEAGEYIAYIGGDSRTENSAHFVLNSISIA